MSKKLELKHLKVKSFVTKAEPTNDKTVKGGIHTFVYATCNCSIYLSGCQTMDFQGGECIESGCGTICIP